VHPLLPLPRLSFHAVLISLAEQVRSMHDLTDRAPIVRSINMKGRECQRGVRTIDETGMQDICQKLGSWLLF